MQYHGEAASNSNSHSNRDSIGNKRYAWVWLNHMDVRISHHRNPLSQTNQCMDIKSSGSIMLISRTWHAHKRKDTKSFEQKQQQEHIGRSNWTGEFHKKIVAKHVCFTVESGPRPTEM